MFLVKVLQGNHYLVRQILANGRVPPTKAKAGGQSNLKKPPPPPPPLTPTDEVERSNTSQEGKGKG